MEKFELQKAISQLLNVLKSHIFFTCELFSDATCSEQLKKSYNFSKIIFVMSSLGKSIVFAQTICMNYVCIPQNQCFERSFGVSTLYLSLELVTW